MVNQKPLSSFQMYNYREILPFFFEKHFIYSSAVVQGWVLNE